MLALIAELKTVPLNFAITIVASKLVCSAKGFLSQEVHSYNKKAVSF